mgnify:CR=1 FL=1
MVVPPKQDIVPASDEATNSVGCVTVMETVKLDDTGAPVYSDWSNRSFCNGMEASEMREKAKLRREEDARNELEKKFMEERVRDNINMFSSVSINSMGLGNQGLKFSSSVSMSHGAGLSANSDMPTIRTVLSGSSEKDIEEVAIYWVEVSSFFNEIFLLEGSEHF